MRHYLYIDDDREVGFNIDSEDYDFSPRDYRITFTDRTKLRNYCLVEIRHG